MRSRQPSTCSNNDQAATLTDANDAYSFGQANANVTDTHNGLNQVTATGGDSVSHDARGNTTAIGSTSYAYTTENRLRAAGSATLTYNPEGTLLSAATPTVTRFDSLAGHIVAERNGGGTVQRRFVPGPAIDEPILWYEGSGTSDRRWFHADERGSVIAVSDGAGNLVGSVNRYDEYGVPEGTLTGRFGYTGQAWLPEAGLYHYRARAYNPRLGRFMQADPIGYGSGMNLYAYVGNDPVNFTDPLGLEQLCYQHITRGWVDSTDPNNPIVTGNRTREICHDMGASPYDGDIGQGGGGGVPRPGECPPNDVVCQVRTRHSVESVMTELGRGLRDPLRECAAGISSVNPSDVGRTGTRSALQGAALGAARGLGMGSFMGPAGSGWGAAGGFVTGTVFGAVRGVVTSVVSQACSR